MKTKPIFKRPSIVRTKTPHGFYWESAYTDAFDTPAMLPSYIYGLLCGYIYEDSLKKYYKTEDSAIQSLRRVMRLIKIHVERYDI